MSTYIIPIFVIFIVLIFHNDVIAGTREGLLLWYRTIIPALLPFILITNTLSEINYYQKTASKFQKKWPAFCEVLAIFLGNLCGYPIGAKILNDLVNSKCISYKKANSLLALSSQASPMFLIGYVYNCILCRKIPLFIFLISIYIPVILLYLIKIKKNGIDHNDNISSYHLSFKTYKHDINNTFLQTTRTIVNIGLYVIIFSIILKIILNISDNNYLKCILAFLEITTGLNLIKNINLNTNILIIISSCLSAFGGICTIYQIKSVLNYPKATIKKYLPDKLLLSAGTFILLTLYIIIKEY